MLARHPELVALLLDLGEKAHILEGDHSLAAKVSSSAIWRGVKPPGSVLRSIMAPEAADR